MPDLIALADLQTITQLNSNVEARKVANAIADVHLECEKVLGRTGYALVYASPGSYTALLAYVKPWMAWRARELAYTDMMFEPERAGMVKVVGDGQESVSRAEVADRKAQDRDRAEARLERLIEYLCDNVATYTWYTTNVNDEERINTSGGSGFILRRSSRQDNYRG